MTLLIGTMLLTASLAVTAAPQLVVRPAGPDTVPVLSHGAGGGAEGIVSAALSPARRSLLANRGPALHLDAGVVHMAPWVCCYAYIRPTYAGLGRLKPRVPVVQTSGLVREKSQGQGGAPDYFDCRTRAI